MSTSLDELARWMAAPREGERLEFKEAKANFDQEKLYAYCVALANEGGGKFVLGVTDRPPRRVVGSAAFRDVGEIATKILDKLHFRVDIEEIAHPDGRVVVFHIPARPVGAAYHVDGRYFMRNGEQLVPMSDDQLRKIHAEGQPDWLATVSKEGCTAADVVALLDTQSYFDLLRLPYPATRDAVLDRFLHEGLVRRTASGWAIPRLAALLFAKSLSAFPDVSRKAPRVVVYDGKGKLKTRLDQPGAKGYAVGFEGLLEFIKAQIPSNEVIEQALRVTVQMFPPAAVRELVANALIHQDFAETGMSVMVELYDDRLEVSNPGVPAIDTKRFIDGYGSRNDRLADLMRRLGICEEKGSGIDRVVAAAEAFQLPAPDFRVGERRTTAVLFAHKEFRAMDREERIRACYQHACLRYVMNEKLTNESLRARFKLPPERAETVSRVIREAVEAKLLIAGDPERGSRRYAWYIPYWAAI